jgi:alpha-glucosidase
LPCAAPCVNPQAAHSFEETAMYCIKKLNLSILALLMGAAMLSAVAQSPSAQSAKPIASERDWWKNAVIYEIYPRSFQDSNGDGIGDLNGITSRLDYLKELGIDAIWLTPCYPSPQVDFGYDISDYENIDPKYGTLADFDRLVAEARKRHIRILMDMVMNHSSDQHKWFLESRSSRDNPYRDWYMWRDGKGETATDKGAPPSNWQSYFGHSAWQWDEKTRQYYYHKFYIQQPDFNWNNPQVHEAFKDIIRFWLKRGVGGFRFDAITELFEDPALTDEGYVLDKDGNKEINAYGDLVVDNSKSSNLPGLHTVVAEMRATADTFPANEFPGTRVMIGETYLPNIAELAKMYGPAGKPEFHLPMDTQVGFINKLDAATFRAKLTDAESGMGDHVPLLLFDNHDNQRLQARYGDGAHDTEIQRALSTVLFLSRGAAQFYYGDEIGMLTTPPTRKEDVKDPIGITGWPKEKGRDGERTPMQWNATANAGFTATSATPWLSVPPSAANLNVAAEKRDPNSLLAWYESVIHLKKSDPSLARGAETMLDASNNSVLSWLRKAPGEAPVVVVVNFTAEPQTVSLSVPGSGGKLKTLLKSPGAADPASLNKITLAPFGVYVGKILP